MNEKELIKRCEELLRLLHYESAPQEAVFRKITDFFKDVISFEFEKMEVLDKKQEPEFKGLCQAIIQKCQQFIQSQTTNLDHAEDILHIVLELESYISNVEHLPWVIGKKISAFEKWNLRSALRTLFHNLYDAAQGRPIRGTHVLVVLAGSLARGYSDYKQIPKTKKPKPSDYDIPKNFLRQEKSLFGHLNRNLIVPTYVKSHLSDVDLLIVNEVLFNSINENLRKNSWMYLLGAKYDRGMGGSLLLDKIYQRISTMKIGGLRGRFINFVILKDEHGYHNYLARRQELLDGLIRRTQREVKINDAIILNQVIR